MSFKIGSEVDWDNWNSVERFPLMLMVQEGRMPMNHPFSIDELPWQNLRVDDPDWYPKLLAGEKFISRFNFDPKTMLDHELIGCQ